MRQGIRTIIGVRMTFTGIPTLAPSYTYRSSSQQVNTVDVSLVLSLRVAELVLTTEELKSLWADLAQSYR